MKWGVVAVETDEQILSILYLRCATAAAAAVAVSADGVSFNSLFEMPGLMVTHQWRTVT